MGESFMWIFALLILMFGGNFGFGNRGPAPDQVTQAELQAGLNNVTIQNQLQQLGIATANNNYETALLINQQSNAMTNQNNANLVNAIQGFNTVNQNITQQANTTNGLIQQMMSKMDTCCCEIKTMMLQNRLDEAERNNVTLQGRIDNAQQTQTILNNLGRFVAWAGSGSPATATTGN